MTYQIFTEYSMSEKSTLEANRGQSSTIIYLLFSTVTRAWSWLRTCVNSHDTRTSCAPFAHINAIPTNPSGVQFQFTRQFCITDSNDFQKFCSDLSLQQTCYHDQSHSIGCLRLCSDADDHFELSHDLLAAVGDSFSQQKHHSLPRFIQTLLGIKG